MALTPKQAAFVAAYIETGNAAQSAITAGYPEASARSVGSENLTKPDIIAAIEAANGTAMQRVQAAQDSAVASAQWIIEQSVRLYERCMQDVPVLTSKGEPTGVYQFDSGGANRALDRLASRHPEFKSGTAVPSQTLILNGLSDAQLDAAIAKLAGGSA